jgi:hypothetical protein
LLLGVYAFAGNRICFDAAKKIIFGIKVEIPVDEARNRTIGHWADQFPPRELDLPCKEVPDSSRNSAALAGLFQQMVLILREGQG